MKIVKKIIYIGIIAVAILIMYATNVKAANTLKVTADTLNLREKASTTADILTLLSNGDTCELIEESGDWYKVKYKAYTGYVTKEYVKKNEDTSTKHEESTSQTEENNVEEQIENQVTETPISEENESEETSSQVTAKISKKTEVKLLPLIYSSNIDSLNKEDTVTITTEVNGWSYVQTDTISGWVRSDSITGKKTSSNVVVDNNNQTPEQKETENNNKVEENNDDENKINEGTTSTSDEQTYTEKTMYVNDSYVNLRKEANTYSNIIMVVEMNTKLTVIGESGEWYKVKTTEGDAYVLKKLLSSRQVTTSRGGIINKSSNLTTTSKTTTESKKKETGTEGSKKVSNSAKGNKIVAYAKQFLGVPYVYGGASKSGFDCSGFTMYVYKQFGISMRHGAQAQAKLGRAVNANKSSASSLKQNLQPGDLVFFLDYETMDEIGHCGIYVGDGNFIHASSGSGYCVKINSLLPGEYYNTRYCGARRII